MGSKDSFKKNHIAFVALFLTGLSFLGALIIGIQHRPQRVNDSLPNIDVIDGDSGIIVVMDSLLTQRDSAIIVVMDSLLLASKRNEQLEAPITTDWWNIIAIITAAITTLIGGFGTIITSLLLWRKGEKETAAMALENQRKALEIEKLRRELDAKKPPDNEAE